MNAQERKQMNALKRWTFGGLLLVLASATGCVAQVGQGSEDPGSAPQQLATEQPAATAAAPQRADIRELQVLQTPDGKLVVGEGPQEGSQELRIDPTVDPGAPLQDDGDGREPDPHPWHGDNVIIAR